MANKGVYRPANFGSPREWRYGINAVDIGFVGDGFYLRRLARDHRSPAIRLPREMIRSLGWCQGELLYVVQDGDMVVIGTLNYEDPQGVAHDKANEVRRKYGNPRPSDNTES